MHTSETHEARNQTRAGAWSSGLSVNSFIITILAVVQMPPADDKVRNRAVVELRDDYQMKPGRTRILLSGSISISLVPISSRRRRAE